MGNRINRITELSQRVALYQARLTQLESKTGSAGKTVLHRLVTMIAAFHFRTQIRFNVAVITGQLKRMGLAKIAKVIEKPYVKPNHITEIAEHLEDLKEIEASGLTAIKTEQSAAKVLGQENQLTVVAQVITRVRTIKNDVAALIQSKSNEVYNELAEVEQKLASEEFLGVESRIERLLRVKQEIAKVLQHKNLPEVQRLQLQTLAGVIDERLAQTKGSLIVYVQKESRSLVELDQSVAQTKTEIAEKLKARQEIVDSNANKLVQVSATKQLAIKELNLLNKKPLSDHLGLFSGNEGLRAVAKAVRANKPIANQDLWAAQKEIQTLKGPQATRVKNALSMYLKAVEQLGFFEEIADSDHGDVDEDANVLQVIERRHGEVEAGIKGAIRVLNAIGGKAAW